MSVQPAGDNYIDPSQRRAMEVEGRVLDLRMKGMTFYAIQKELKITNADRVFKRAMQRVETLREEAYKLEQARLDKLNSAVWDGAAAGSLPHVDRALNISNSRSRLIGLNHSDRAQDAAIEIEQAKLKLVAMALARGLEAGNIDPETREVIMAEFAKALDFEDAVQELI